MKNIMIIDGAENCTYDIFAAEDAEFEQIFGDKEVIFIEDLVKGKKKGFFNPIFKAIWKRPVGKKDVAGIHGTIFYEQYYKKQYFEDGSWKGWSMGKRS